MEVAGLSGTINYYPINPNNHMQTKTNKNKSDKFGEVFTPLWLVDKMLNMKSNHNWKGNNTTLDMCAGYGQFTIRILRKKYSILGRSFNLKHFLYESHSFNEIQFSSIFKLMYIFGSNINLFIGDARKLTELPKDAKGIMLYSEPLNKWCDVTEKTQQIFKKCQDDEEFVEKFTDEI